MILSFDLTKEDYIEYNVHFVKTDPTMQKTYHGAQAALPALLLAVALFEVFVQQGRAVFWVPLALVFSGLWMLLLPRCYMGSFRRRVGKLVENGRIPGVVGHHELTCENGELADVTENSVTRYNTVEKIVETDKWLYLFVSPIMAYLVPLRAFRAQEEKDRFLALVEPMLRHAPKGGPS